jgi:4'-phosphopantetheinyl transferase
MIISRLAWSEPDDRPKDMKPSWNPPPTQLLLSRKDVHIWRAGLDLPSKSVQELKGSLSFDERMKAERFSFARDRSRFIAARGILKLILASYLSVEPGAIRFCYEKDGKPRLQTAFGKTNIQFNLSHSEGFALYVFTRGHEVGVDVERIQDFPEMEQIVEQFFSVRERVAFGTLSTSEKQETFFSWWTRKEAFTKATGEGLSHPLDMVDALLADGKSVESLGILENIQEEPRWSIWDVRPAEEFAGAVVVEGGDWDGQCLQWLG